MKAKQYRKVTEKEFDEFLLKYIDNPLVTGSFNEITQFKDDKGLTVAYIIKGWSESDTEFNIIDLNEIK